MQIWLGVRGKERAKNLIKHLGLSYEDDNEEKLEEDMVKRTLDTSLKYAQQRAFTEVGIFNPMTGPGGKGIHYDETPLGERDFDCWEFQLKGDIFGIRLTGTNYPVFLDWKQDDGGLEAVTEEHLELIEIAKKYISPIWPDVNSLTFVVERHV